jgi:hypothetical protein
LATGIFEIRIANRQQKCRLAGWIMLAQSLSVRWDKPVSLYGDASHTCGGVAETFQRSASVTIFPADPFWLRKITTYPQTLAHRTFSHASLNDGDTF